MANVVVHILGQNLDRRFDKSRWVIHRHVANGGDAAFFPDGAKVPQKIFLQLVLAAWGAARAAFVPLLIFCHFAPLQNGYATCAQALRSLIFDTVT